MSLKSTLESSDKIKYDIYLKGLTAKTVRAISAAQKEPKWMLEHRLQALEIFKKMPMPNRGPDLSKLHLDDIVYFAKPHKDSAGYATKREDVPQDIKMKFERLGIPEAERKYLAGAGGQYDSLNIYHQIKDQRSKKWIIFADMPEAVQKYPDLVKKHFMKLVPASDHKFAALHAAVRSGWTFIFVPKGIKLEEPLQAYFRMNALSGGQFEHTLIILEDDAEGAYIEGCSAPKYDRASLHAGCVEIYVGKNSKMKYSSVENRSTNTYNLNTKRALVKDHGYMEWVSGNLGSCTTMLYPCSILQGDHSSTELLGIAVASKNQFQDIGAKAIHLGKHTSSKIVSRALSKYGWVNTYRGLVKIAKNADFATSYTQCDTLLFDKISVSNAIPNIVCDNQTAILAHEATAGKIDDAELFYLMARGITKEKAMSMIVHGFFSQVVKKLPLEYAGELNKLIDMEIEE